MKTQTTWPGMDVNRHATLTREERIATGKAARQQTPRSSHGEWTPAPNRLDPIALIESQGARRFPTLLPLRYGRMSKSPFAFLRGSAIVMAQDLANTPISGIQAQICGDAHLANFGAFASPERRLVFDINDFDETLQGPWEWDVKRLAASIVMAGRSLGFTERTNADLVAHAMQTYRQKMWEYSEQSVLDVWYTQLDSEELVGQLKPTLRSRFRAGMNKARKRGRVEAFSKMTEVVNSARRFKEFPPMLTHVSIKGDLETVRADFDSYRESLPYERRILLDRYHFVDVALKVVGVGSVGTGCFAVLLDAGHDQDPLLLQIKEANESVLEQHLGPSPFANHGQRVVVGQRLMQAASDIFLGWLHDDANGRDYYVRQLRDMKYSVDLKKGTPKLMVFYIELCANTLARAHARTSDAAILAGYMGKSDAFDQALVKFAIAYADQTECDHAALVAAIKTATINTSVNSA
jgi:uncharacterized protein (DUF2252 family)